MKELINAVAESYEETGELKITANKFHMSLLKIRKMLITAGVCFRSSLRQSWLKGEKAVPSDIRLC